MIFAYNKRSRRLNASKRVDRRTSRNDREAIAKCKFAAYFFYFSSNRISARERETIKFTLRIKKPTPLSCTLTLPTLLTKLPPACSMILPTFSRIHSAIWPFLPLRPRLSSYPPTLPSPPSHPPRRRRHTTSTRRTPRVCARNTRTRRAIRRAAPQGKFPAILRLHGGNNSSCPVKLLRFPRATCDESDQNLNAHGRRCVVSRKR